MDFSTGCISVGAGDSQIQVDRVIEYIQLTTHSFVLWVDIFFQNHSSESQSLTVLHRGSFSASDVTRASWALAEPPRLLFERSLSERLIQLHADSEPVGLATKGVSIDGHVYQIPEAGCKVTTVVGGVSDIDTPFTMWEVGSFYGPERHLIRLRLPMNPETYRNRVGQRDRFYAYGETILLEKIQLQDLPAYNGPELEKYCQAFITFSGRRHAVPDKFEYVIVGAEHAPLDWTATSLNSHLSERWIKSQELRRSTMWFVSETLHSGDWSLVGKTRNNEFAVRFKPEKRIGADLAGVVSAGQPPKLSNDSAG
jgi:hypothetical protein